MTAPKAARSDRYGRRYYPVPDGDGVLHDLPSWTRLSKLLDAPGLNTWKLKGVAKQVALRPDLQMLAADDETVYQAVKQALDATQDRANVGTGVHRYCELADKGVLDMEQVPVPARGFLANYIACQRERGWTVVEAECTVANFAIGYACTPDRFVRWPDDELVPGGGVVNLDLKTGKDVYPDMAHQLAAGAHGETIWTPPADDDLPFSKAALQELERDIAEGRNIPAGRRKWSQEAIKQARADVDELYWQEFAQWPGHRPMPEGIRTDIGIILHLTEDACVPVAIRLDTDVPAIAVVAALRTVYGWDAGKESVIKVAGDGAGETGGQGTATVAPAADAGAVEPPSAAPAEPPELAAAMFLTEHPDPGMSVEELARVLTVDERRAYLRARLAHTATTPAAIEFVASHWPRGVALLREDNAHDHAALDRIEALVTEADGRFGVEFPAVSPAEFKAPKDDDEGVDRVLSAFPGARELGPLEHRKAMLGKRVVELSRSKPDECEAFMAALREQGLAKSLRTAEWSRSELDSLEAALTFAETGKAPTTKGKKQHATA